VLSPERVPPQRSPPSACLPLGQAWRKKELPLRHPWVSVPGWAPWRQRPSHLPEVRLPVHGSQRLFAVRAPPFLLRLQHPPPRNFPGDVWRPQARLHRPGSASPDSEHCAAGLALPPLSACHCLHPATACLLAAPPSPARPPTPLSPIPAPASACAPPVAV